MTADNCKLRRFKKLIFCLTSVLHVAVEFTYCCLYVFYMLQPYYPFREWDPHLTPVAQPKLNYLAPEYALTSTCDPASDMFAVGLLIHALHNGGRTIFDSMGDWSIFRKNADQVAGRHSWYTMHKWAVGTDLFYWKPLKTELTARCSETSAVYCLLCCFYLVPEIVPHFSSFVTSFVCVLRAFPSLQSVGLVTQMPGVSNP